MAGIATRGIIGSFAALLHCHQGGATTTTVVEIDGIVVFHYCLSYPPPHGGQPVRRQRQQQWLPSGGILVRALQGKWSGGSVDAYGIHHCSGGGLAMAGDSERANGGRAGLEGRRRRAMRHPCPPGQSRCSIECCRVRPGRLPGQEAGLCSSMHAGFADGISTRMGQSIVK